MSDLSVIKTFPKKSLEKVKLKRYAKQKKMDLVIWIVYNHCPADPGFSFSLVDP